MPPGTTVNGSTVVEGTGGVDDSGVLKITKNLNSQSGSFVIDDLDGGAFVYGFELNAKVRVGGGTGTPADGFSINLDPLAGPNTVVGEEGTSGGIAFTFDIYDNSNENPPAPSIDVKVGGQVVATHKMTIADFDTGSGFTDLNITVAADGAVSLSWKGQKLFDNVYFPGYQPIPGGFFVIGGRTGGLNANQWIDNLTITTFTTPMVGFSQQPMSVTAVAGSDITLVAGVNNADGATFQWFRDGTAITGETNPTLTLPAVSAGDSGARFTLQVTGPNNTITSNEAVLTVRSVPGPVSPQIDYNFDDGATPPGALLFETGLAFGVAGYIALNGGVNDSGVLHLTDAANDAAGGIVIEDVNAGAPVYGFTAAFDVLVGGGSDVPADGFSFSFASDIPDAPTGELENGVGTGVSIGFDIFDNGGGEAPSVDVRVGGTVIASTKVPLSVLRTGFEYVPVLINLENDGTLDVAYNGILLHDNVTLPGFSNVTAGRFAIGGRTGGLNENQWIDNLQISTTTTAGDLRIITQPVPRTVPVGSPATFSAVLNDETGATYQWFRNGSAIAGATGSSYTLSPTTVGDSGALFKVTATRGALNVTSDEVALTVVDIARPATPTVSYDFNDGLVPADTTVVFNTEGIAGYVAVTGGVDDSGVLHIVDAVNNASGGFIVPAQHGGAEIESFVAAFDLLVGGGTASPADGFSFNFAPDVPMGTIGEAENGGGSGLRVTVDLWDNGNETPPAPSIDVWWQGAIVASVQQPFSAFLTDGGYVTMIVRLNANGTVDVSYGDRVYFQNVQLPNYSPITNGRFGWYSRTGGANANVWVDNIAILANKTTAPLRITTDITGVNLLPGNTTTFTVGVSDPNGVTYQWFRDDSAIAGATSASYTPPAFTLADTGATFHVVATGPGGTATSSDAVVTVVAPITIANPDFSVNFDDGTIPLEATINGTTYVGGEGALHLTDAAEGQQGTIIISDLDNGEPVNAFTASFDLLVGGGTATPADGLSFVWVNDIEPTTAFGEDGSGTGLVISFDIFDNGNETPPAPSIDVRYKGTLVATAKKTFQEMETGDQFANFTIRVENDGTLDLHYKGEVVFHNIQLPDFQAASGAMFGIGARTGGLTENQWIDNLEIVTSTGTVTLIEFTSITREGNSVTLTWTGGGTLQAAPTVTGPWGDVTGATSPETVQMSGDMQFFRVVSGGE